MPATITRQDAHQLVELLPAAFSWDDLMQGIYERAALERGLADSAAGRVRDVSDVRREFNLGR